MSRFFALALVAALVAATPVFAAEPECERLPLASDNAHAVFRQGWEDPTVPPPALPSGMVRMGVAPDVSSVERATPVRTKESNLLVLRAGNGRQCVSFGDVRAFRYAYKPTFGGQDTAFLMVVVNGRQAVDEWGSTYFRPDGTDLVVNGLKAGDVVEVLVLVEGFEVARTCQDVPTENTEISCTRGLRLYEQRRYKI